MIRVVDHRSCPPNVNALTISHWIPDGSGPPLLAGATIGSRLREVAAEVPDRVALVEGVGDAGATALDLCRAARRRRALRAIPSAALRAGRARRGVGAQPARVGAARVRRGARRVDAGDGQPEPAAGRGDLRARAVAGGRVVPRARGPRQPAGGARRGDPRRPARAAPRAAPRPARRADRRPTDATVALPAVGADDPAQIQYTSGTTGFPKGAVLRHGGIVNNARLWADRVEIPDGAGWLLADAAVPHGWVRDGRARGARPAGDARADADVRPGLFLELIELERPWFADGRADDAHRRDGPPGRVAPRPVVVAVDGVRRCPGARGAGAAHRGGTRRRLHDRLRPDRVLARPHEHLPVRQRRGQGADRRTAAPAHRGAHRRSGLAGDGADRHARRAVGPRVLHDARLLRQARRDGRDAARRRLAAHRATWRRWTSAATAGSSAGSRT